jgi:hypothetical protein
MATPQRTRIEPTAEQLQAAWMARRRSSWPTTLEDTLAVPLYAALVRMHAVRTLLRQQALPATSAQPAAAAPQAVPPNWLRRSGQLAGLDRKRAAAGDRDD